MSTITSRIQENAAAAIREQYDIDLAPGILPIQETRKEFVGDFTLVVFPLTKYKLGAPPQIGETLGKALLARMEEVEDYNVIKGFLNLSLSEDWWRSFLADNMDNPAFLSREEGRGKKVVVEYCSPNTNKPLHLGHLRNIVLGDSLTRVLEANGYEVHPACLFNDRGTNISKSMYAWQQAGRDDSPESAGVKGDKFVGDYYVDYAGLHSEEVKALVAQGMSREEAEAKAPSTLGVLDMTVRWEDGDPEIRALWEKSNGWVYAAFEETFKRLRIAFEQYYYESEVYQLGKEAVQEGLDMGIFYRTEDGSVEVDLSEEGLDKKTLLRSNGTSLYITQDLAIADAKYNQYAMDKSIYVVGNEQDYHFKVLFTILRKLGKPYSDGLFHLSYGMVDLPSGKMKSREGTTVEADDLLNELIEKAKEETQKLGKTEEMDSEELQSLYETLGLAALKYYLVKVDPKRRMLFDPKESIDLHGNTGPFIQYSYARIRSMERKADDVQTFSTEMKPELPLLDVEKELLRQIFRFPQVLREAGEGYNPALLANFAYDLAREFNRFYHDAPVLKSDQPKTSAFRFALSRLTGTVLRRSLSLLGITMPERM